MFWRTNQPVCEAPRRPAEGAQDCPKVRRETLASGRNEADEHRDHGGGDQHTVERHISSLLSDGEECERGRHAHLELHQKCSAAHAAAS